jgi:hydroxyethylthiazole kinase-like uncharacterized protein yjeF
MQRITPGLAWPLHDAAATRAIESAAAAGLPPHTLMQRAGAAVARLALALAPHARTVWVACGPGNNGGDGLEAASHLASAHRRVIVTCLGDPDTLPEDARHSLARAQAAGVTFSHEPPEQADLVIDAILGIGARRPLEGRAAQWQARIAQATQAGAPVLAIDLPSGLDADTGQGPAIHATHTLSLLTLKPGLFTARGRDAAGTIWFDDLASSDFSSAVAASATLNPAPLARTRPHASHKGSWGDVAVIGGAPGMTGAALLAARAALHAGAGRVFVGLLASTEAAHAPSTLAWDPIQPELMFRAIAALDLARLHIACGCGGGEAVRAELPRILSRASTLVLDADALNAIAADTGLQTLLRARCARQPDTTVLTPHPLEVARLLATSTEQVQADRVGAARALTDRFGTVSVIKGSGSVIAAPGRVPSINPTGHAGLATAGTGDVLAGWVAARLANGLTAADAAASAVYAHGALADAWPHEQALVASRLAQRIR